MDDVLLIAGCDNPLTADFAMHCRHQARARVACVAARHVLKLIDDKPIYSCEADGFSASTFLGNHPGGRLAGAIVFLDRDNPVRQQALLEEVAKTVAEKRARRVCIVSSFLVHFGDRKAAAAEKLAQRLLGGAGERTVVIRPGYVLSENAPLTSILKRRRKWMAALPVCFRSCCVRGETLFQVIDQEFDDQRRLRNRIVTVLGPNQPWSVLATEHEERTRQRVFQRFVALLLGFFIVGQILAWAFALVAKRLPWLRSWSFDTLHPETPGELLALYNKHNYQNVKIVGYNNGVTHFGQRYSGKTIVSTIRCVRPPRVRGSIAKCDGGATIHTAMHALRTLGKELHVLPNYSYVSLGTSFFVPIHGSACHFSTVGETIEKVLLFDPTQDHFIVARRGSAAFGHYMYNLRADVLLLRLYLQVKPKSCYYVRQQELANPASAAVIGLFHDEAASNVELRKAGSASPTVTVSKYYAEAPAGQTAGLEVPRDRLGSLWDRLEENRLTSLLFHGLTRRFAHHVELFLSEPEFSIFWNTHGTLPIKKIQLRYIKRDGFPNSPFQKDDCISADLFMLKKDRGAFDAYVRDTFGAVRMNPGKHSM